MLCRRISLIDLFALSVDIVNDHNLIHIVIARWKLKINISKTKIIIFSKGKRKWSNFRFMMINDQKIEVVEKYKYLGVILAYIIINGNLKHAATAFCSTCSSKSNNLGLISYVIKL